MLNNLLSVRVWVLAVLAAGIIAALLDQVAPGTGKVIVYPLFFVFLALLVIAPGVVARCPWCGRRVVLGASVCSRCGRDVSP